MLLKFQLNWVMYLKRCGDLINSKTNHFTIIRPCFISTFFKYTGLFVSKFITSTFGGIGNFSAHLLLLNSHHIPLKLVTPTKLRCTLFPRCASNFIVIPVLNSRKWNSCRFRARYCALSRHRLRYRPACRCACALGYIRLQFPRICSAQGLRGCLVSSSQPLLPCLKPLFRLAPHF